LPSIEIEARGSTICDPITGTASRVVVELRPDDIERCGVDHFRHVGIRKWALGSTCNEVLLVAPSGFVVFCEQQLQLVDASNIPILIVWFY
jgi:hypothetical protein